MLDKPRGVSGPFARFGDVFGDFLFLMITLSVLTVHLPHRQTTHKQSTDTGMAISCQAKNTGQAKNTENSWPLAWKLNTLSIGKGAHHLACDTTRCSSTFCNPHRAQLSLDLWIANSRTLVAKRWFLRLLFWLPVGAEAQFSCPRATSSYGPCH